MKGLIRAKYQCEIEGNYLPDIIETVTILSSEYDREYEEKLYRIMDRYNIMRLKFGSIGEAIKEKPKYCSV